MVAFESMEWHGLWDDAMTRKWRLLNSEVNNKGKKNKTRSDLTNHGL